MIPSPTKNWAVIVVIGINKRRDDFRRDVTRDPPWRIHGSPPSGAEPHRQGLDDQSRNRPPQLCQCWELSELSAGFLECQSTGLYGTFGVGLFPKIWGKNHGKNQPLMGRFDNFKGPRWKMESFVPKVRSNYCWAEKLFGENFTLEISWNITNQRNPCLGSWKGHIYHRNQKS